MFFANVGSQWGSVDASSAAGVIVGAAHQTAAKALRRDRDPLCGQILFDPQLYMLDLDPVPDEHPGLLGRLATYIWFGMAAPPFDSDQIGVQAWGREIEQRIGELWNARTSPLAGWDASVRAAVEFQVQFGTSAIILPATLIADPESDLDGDLARLDHAIAIARELTALPLFASVPIDESALRHRDGSSSPLIESIADGVSAREDLHGVYLVLGSQGTVRERVSNRRVAGAMFWLCRLFGRLGGLKVIVNYAEMLGAVCMAAGAQGYASGFGVKGRRLNINDFRQRGGGAAFPKMASAGLLADLLPERDLDRLADARLLRYVERDSTPSSKNLLDALAAGRRSRDVEPWEERRNNLDAARRHYVEVQQQAIGRATSEQQALAWLQEAEAAWAYITQRFRDAPIYSDGTHLTTWRGGVEDLLDGISRGSLPDGT